MSSDKPSFKNSTLQGVAFTTKICLAKFSYYLKGFLKISFAAGIDRHHNLRVTNTKFYS